jgi:hypothetical protein
MRDVSGEDAVRFLFEHLVLICTVLPFLMPGRIGLAIGAASFYTLLVPVLFTDGDTVGGQLAMSLAAGAIPPFSVGLVLRCALEVVLWRTRRSRASRGSTTTELSTSEG